MKDLKSLVPHSLLSQEVEDLDGEAGVLAILDKLAEVREPVLLGLRVLLDHGDDGVRNAGLVKKLINVFS